MFKIIYLATLSYKLTLSKPFKSPTINFASLNFYEKNVIIKIIISYREIIAPRIKSQLTPNAVKQNAVSYSESKAIHMAFSRVYLHNIFWRKKNKQNRNNCYCNCNATSIFFLFGSLCNLCTYQDFFSFSVEEPKL